MRQRQRQKQRTHSPSPKNAVNALELSKNGPPFEEARAARPAANPFPSTPSAQTATKDVEKRKRERCILATFNSEGSGPVQIRSEQEEKGKGKKNWCKLK
jgi:hypothetical protein